MATLVLTDGTPVTLGHFHLMVDGPHKGTWWRIEELFHDGSEHKVRASYRHRAGRVRRVFHPSVFGLMVQEELTRMRLVVNRLHHAWQKIDEGLIMGVLALVPLAVFEAYHGGEATREFLASILGG